MNADSLVHAAGRDRFDRWYLPGVSAASQGPRPSRKIAAGLQPLTTVLEGKYWVDEIYDAVIVEPLRHLSKVFFAIDRMVVDSVGVGSRNGAAAFGFCR